MIRQRRETMCCHDPQCPIIDEPLWSGKRLFFGFGRWLYMADRTLPAAWPHHGLGWYLRWYRRYHAKEAWKARQQCDDPHCPLTDAPFWTIRRITRGAAWRLHFVVWHGQPKYSLWWHVRFYDRRHARDRWKRTQEHEQEGT